MPSRKKLSVFQQRQDKWRKDRAAAQTIRSAFPAATRINLHLQFFHASAEIPTAQSFELHPPARAHFAYPCPYGDCDGIFDLSAAVAGALTCATSHVEGTLECHGTRSRDGLQRQPCGLCVSYTIAAQYKAESASRT